MPHSDHKVANEHRKDLELLRDAVSGAAEIVRQKRKQTVAAWQKEDGTGPVTEIDLAVDSYLRERLLAARPGYGWLSEETLDDPARLLRERVFIVDPIDGTRSLMSGRTDFSIAAAVAERGTPVASVVHLPARNEVFEAVQHGGTCHNGENPRPSTRTNLEGARFLGPRSALRDRHWRGASPKVKVLQLVPLAFRICQVASGRADATITFWNAWEWDIAAADLIAREAGLRTSDAQGRELRYNAKSSRAQGLVIAPPVLHQAILDRFQSPDPGQEIVR